MTIDVGFEGFPDFNYLLDELSNPTNTVRAIASFSRSEFAKRTALNLNPYDEPQTSLTPEYRKEKERAVGKRVILSRSGKMLRSYYQVVSSQGFLEGLKSDIAIYHQDAQPPRKVRLLLFTEKRGMSARYQKKVLDLALTDVERAFRQSKR
jgi:hypothetical protein